MRSAPSVSAGLALGLLDYAVSKGASRDGMLVEAALKPEVLTDADARVPLARYQALMQAGQRLAGDPALALHFAEDTDLARYSVLGLIGDSCTDMMEAFAQFARYVRLAVEVDLGPGERFRQEMAENALWLVDARPEPNAFPELTESAFARIVCWVRKISGLDFAQEVRVTHDAPPYRECYERIFRAPVSFSSAQNAMRINPAVLSFRIARQPRYVFGILTKHADAMLDQLDRSKLLSGRIEALILPVLHTGKANAAHVAATLGLSRQTLYRQLKLEQTNFEQVLDGLRARMAKDYLGAQRVSVNEAAYLTGFSEPAAFSRAFKRWTGVSPRAYARSLTGG